MIFTCCDTHCSDGCEGECYGHDEPCRLCTGYKAQGGQAPWYR